MSVNSRLKAVQVTVQRKPFYRQRIPEPSSAKKETADIGILITSRNGEKKRKKEVEPVEPVQMNIYQSSTYRKTLNCLHFEDEPRVQGRQPEKDQQSITVFVSNLKILSSN